MKLQSPTAPPSIMGIDALAYIVSVETEDKFCGCWDKRKMAFKNQDFMTGDFTYSYIFKGKENSLLCNIISIGRITNTILKDMQKYIDSFGITYDKKEQPLFLLYLLWHTIWYPYLAGSALFRTNVHSKMT